MADTKFLRPQKIMKTSMRTPRQRERQIETYLKLSVERIGGLTRKYVSPGYAGVPDRLVFYKGRIYLVELKTTGGLLSAVQHAEIKRMAQVGVPVIVLSSKAEVDKFMKDLVDDRVVKAIKCRRCGNIIQRLFSPGELKAYEQGLSSTEDVMFLTHSVCVDCINKE